MSKAEQVLLSVENLAVTIHRGSRRVAALNGVNLSVSAGEVVGLVGESGGGKSMVARAIVGLLPQGSRATGHVWFQHPDDPQPVDVLRLSPEQLREHRGRGAALCFQNPRGALIGTRTVGRQLTDRLTTHQGLSGQQARQTARELFELVGIRNPARRLEAYPHELSGGMAQRVMISLATGCAPGLLIADEPTTGLDVTLTREILQQFRKLADGVGAATDGYRRGVLLISHDLASAAQVCDRVVVLYAGTVVESGPTQQVLREPAHPYTRALLASVPDVDGRPVTATAGGMPLLTEPPRQCPFVPRCAHATDRCRQERPRLTTHGPNWELACFHPQSGPPVTVPTAPAAAAPAAAPTTPLAIVTTPATAGPVAVPAPRAGATEPPTVLDLTDVEVVYGSRFGSGGHRALWGVSLRVAAGETVGVVGESGCGKSTLARTIVGLVRPAAGKVVVGGHDLTRLRGRELRRLRTRAQMVFQDPIGSLSPRRTVADAVAEPLWALGVPARERAERVEAAITQMGLDASILTRYPHELSGGQAQRVGIARALVGEPDLIVFDEPTSALDVTVQAQILEVIGEVTARQADRGSVFISHDLATIRGFCDRVVVLYLGRIVEEGPVEEVFTNPRHPYTRALLSSAPSLAGGFAGPRVELIKDLEEADAVAGCPLAARCPFVTDRCRTEPQQLLPYGTNRAACWRAPEIPALLDGEQARV